MSRYRVIAPMGVTIRTPMVLTGLSAAQLAPRKHLLEEVKGGHRPIRAVSFKQGEVIGLEGEVSRALLEEVGDVVTGEKGSDKVKAAEAERQKALRKKQKAEAAAKEAAAKEAAAKEAAAKAAAGNGKT